MSNVTVNISFQDKLLSDIDRIARKQSRTRSEIVREAARIYIERKDRWVRMFSVGRAMAGKKGLKLEDVASEIAAHRRVKARSK